MAQKLGAVGVLDIILGGDTALFKKAVGDAEKSLGRVEGKLADSAKAAALFSAAALAAGTAVFAMVSRVSEAIDEIAKMSQKLGMSVEEFSALKYAAEISDVSVESLSTGIRQLSKNLLDAINDTGDAKDMLAALDVQLLDTNGKLKPTEEQLLALADSFKAMRESDRTAAAMKIFGKAGADLLPLLIQGRAGIEALKREAASLGVVITEEAARAADEFNDSLTRIKAGVQGATISISGPFIKAFGDAAVAMLAAQKRGESFFRVVSEGLMLLAMGDDLKNWQRQMIAAEEAERQAFNDRLKAVQENKQRGSAWTKLAVQEAEERWQAAKQEVERLQSIKPILAPEAPAAPSGGGGENTVTTDAERSAIEKRAAEIRAIIQQEGEKRDKLELAQIEKRSKDQADAEDKFQQQQIELREYFVDREVEMGQARLDRMKLLKEFEFKSDEELAIEEHEKKLSQLQVFTDAELEQLGGRQAVIEQMEQEHQNKLYGIRSRGLTTLAAFNKASWQQQGKTIFGELANITAGVSQHSKALFQINKVAGIANAIISAHEGISLTMAKYPYPLNIAMAAAHGVAAFAQLNAIRSASFGGGGGGAAPSIAASTPAPPVSPVGGSAGAGSSQTLILKGVNPGDMFSGSQIRQIFERFGEEGRDGGRFEKVIFA